MRPSDAPFGGRARSTDNDAVPGLHAPTLPQMAYALADESTVDASLEQSLATLHRSREVRKHPATDKNEAGPGSAALQHPAPRSTPTRDEFPGGEGSAVDQESRPNTPSNKSSGTPASHAQLSISQPMTPIMLGASGPASALSGASSRRNSLSGSFSEDLTNDGTGENQMGQSSSMMDSGSAPQLVMPSIKMPSRRPFTEEGKNLGRLKVLVAGNSGRLAFSRI